MLWAFVHPHPKRPPPACFDAAQVPSEPTDSAMETIVIILWVAILCGELVVILLIFVVLRSAFRLKTHPPPLDQVRRLVASPPAH